MTAMAMVALAALWVGVGFRLQHLRLRRLERQVAHLSELHTQHMAITAKQSDTFANLIAAIEALNGSIDHLTARRDDGAA